MGAVYATPDDVMTLGRVLTNEEAEKVPTLLEIASALLRTEAKKRGYDLDEMISDDPDKGLIAKILTVNGVVRSLNAAGDTSPAAVQGSQSAMGYSVSYTYLNAGQDIYFLRNELKELGLMRQKCGTLEVYDYGDTRDTDRAGGQGADRH
jgi:hypothetical protein